MDKRKNLVEQLGIDQELVKPCGSSACCHYGEGCALGYPLVTQLNNGWGASFREDDIEDIKMLYSQEFKEYWQTQLNQTEKDWEYARYQYRKRLGMASYDSLRKITENQVLPCCHQGCRASNCNYLHDSNFMSRWYRAR